MPLYCLQIREKNAIEIIIIIKITKNNKKQVYWAMCFRSYRIKKAIILSSILGAPVDHVAMPHRGGPPPHHHHHHGPPPPGVPPPMMPGGSGAMPMHGMGPSGRNIIVLNNSKPSHKDSSKKVSPPPPYDS